MKNNTVLCKDCDYMKNDDSTYRCGHASTIKINLATGDIMYYSCVTERGLYTDSVCRPEGKLFKQKYIQGEYGGEV
jgi:hypothetical protein